VSKGPLAQGDANPLGPVRAGELMNAVFRVYRYGRTARAWPAGI
jgi:hypothetical protein